ncbi:MAG: cation diffusion facilitator family transporter [Polyangiaceae bacterium]
MLPEHAPHGHDHGHGHGHEHVHETVKVLASGAMHGGFTPGEARQARRLLMVLGLVSAFFVVELGGAFIADSVVLQADAVHLLMDVLALGVSALAMRLAVLRPTPRFTYGLRRAEPVAAVFSSLLVLVTTGLIVAEAIGALKGHAAPRAGVMVVVASMALVVNGLSAWLLHDAIEDAHGHAHGHALNLRGAWLHLLGDTLGALAALVAALVIRYGGHPAADPIASFLVAAILLYGSLRLLRDATLVLLESAPRHMPVATIREAITGFPGVNAVHDLHVWTLGAGHDAITVHVRTTSRDPAFGQDLCNHIRGLLEAEYVTVQVEHVL